jgi:hypothetical protein
MPKYIVEYSKVQKAYHVSTWRERAKNELICEIKGINTGYEVIKECFSYEDACDYVLEKINSICDTQIQH